MRRALIAAAAFAAILAVIWVAMDRFARPAPVTLTGAEADPVAGIAGEARIYLKIENGGEPDRLIGASSPEAAGAAFAGMVKRDGYAIPAGAQPSLSEDGVYIALSGIEGALEEGRLIPVTLEFDRSGKASTRARVGPPADPHAMQNMGGAMADLTGDAPTPEIALSVTEGDEGGWSIRIDTRGFTFDPPAEDPAHVPGHGHGHLYLDGVKLQRLYGPEAEIGALPPGRYDIVVTLNTNTHEPYLDGEMPVTATATIEAR